MRAALRLSAAAAADSSGRERGGREPAAGLPWRGGEGERDTEEQGERGERGGGTGGEIRRASSQPSSKSVLRAVLSDLQQLAAAPGLISAPNFNPHFYPPTPLPHRLLPPPPLLQPLLAVREKDAANFLRQPPSPRGRTSPLVSSRSISGGSRSDHSHPPLRPPAPSLRSIPPLRPSSPSALLRPSALLPRRPLHPVISIPRTLVPCGADFRRQPDGGPDFCFSSEVARLAKPIFY